jgi:prophage tail gpP-like protein
MSNIKPTPTQGYQYKVVAGDRIDNIEKTAYGYITKMIEGANPFLSTRGISLENRPILWVDDILTIPVLAELQEIKTDLANSQLQGKSQEEISIIVENRELKFINARIIRTMDTAADSWTCRIAWTPGLDKELDKLVLPYTYPNVKVYIGNELIINGSLYSVSPEQTKNGLTLTLQGFSYAIDIVDSTMPAPYSVDNITLQDRANQLLQHIGIKAIFEADPGGPFDRVTGEITDTIFNHLAELATQRGLLISSTPDGNLLFTKTSTLPVVGTIESGNPQMLTWRANFDGRKLFNQITAIGESPGNAVKKAIAIDSNIPKSRFFTFNANETTDGDIQQSANWKKTKQYADALTLSTPVVGWYSPNGQLWKENTKVTVISPEIFIPNGFDFLIRQVEYVMENSGRTTTLSLVPPSVYTGEEIILPWEVTI